MLLEWQRSSLTKHRVHRKTLMHSLWLLSSHRSCAADFFPATLVNAILGLQKDRPTTEDEVETALCEIPPALAPSQLRDKRAALPMLEPKHASDLTALQKLLDLLLEDQNEDNDVQDESYTASSATS